MATRLAGAEERLKRRKDSIPTLGMTFDVKPKITVRDEAEPNWRIIVAGITRPAVPLVLNIVGDQPMALGSCAFVKDRSGRILAVSNHHVVEGSDRLELVMPGEGGATLDATVLGLDLDNDLAIIGPPAGESWPDDLPTLDMAADFDDQEDVGSDLVAIGNPFGITNLCSYGNLCGIKSDVVNPGGHEVKDLLVVDQLINPGNSGGPTTNRDGNIVGFNTFIATQGMGLGFAVPGKLARALLKDLPDGLASAEIIPGLRILNTMQGVVVRRVEPGNRKVSPAYRENLIPLTRPVPPKQIDDTLKGRFWDLSSLQSTSNEQRVAAHRKTFGERTHLGDVHFLEQIDGQDVFSVSQAVTLLRKSAGGEKRNFIFREGARGSVGRPMDLPVANGLSELPV
jgi:S1-C subfamily serine protease